MSDTIWDEMHQQNRDRPIYEQAANYAYDYLDTVDARSVFPTPDALARLAEFDEPLPDQPQAVPDILRTLHEIGSPATVAQGGGYGWSGCSSHRCG